MTERTDETLSPAVDWFENHADWTTWSTANSDLLDARYREQQRWFEELPNGICRLCGSDQGFRWREPGNPDFRELVACNGCDLSARSRVGLDLLTEGLDALKGRIYLTEQSSPVYAWLKKRYRGARGTEYAPSLRLRYALTKHLRLLGVREWVRFGDCTRLPFRDQRFDAIATFDVLEHVPDFKAALAEFRRILADGGKLVLTVPFYWDRHPSRQIVTCAADGTLQHVGEPEYHGDPMGEPVLCWHHFGWDLLDHVRAAGFGHAAMGLTWNPASGIAGMNWTMLARR